MKKFSIILVCLAGNFVAANAQLEFCLPVEEYTLVALQNPEISDVEISGSDMIDTLEFRTDMVVEEGSGGLEETGNESDKTLLVRAKGKISYLSDSSSADVKSLAGLPNTRIDITAIKGGFHYNNRIWYPTGSKKAFIVCVKDKVIGYNVGVK